MERMNEWRKMKTVPVRLVSAPTVQHRKKNQNEKKKIRAKSKERNGTRPHATLYSWDPRAKERMHVPRTHPRASPKRPADEKDERKRCSHPTQNPTQEEKKNKNTDRIKWPILRAPCDPRDPPKVGSTYPPLIHCNTDTQKI